MAESCSDKRMGERVGARLALEFDGGHGFTRDVSASGVYFETDASCGIGEQISFAVDFESPAGKMVLKCVGQIVRVEHKDGHIGVAVQIDESHLELDGNAGRKPVDCAVRESVG